MKRSTVLVLMVVFFLMPSVNAGEKDTQIKGWEETPFYFPEGVVKETKDKLAQYQEYMRYWNATFMRYQGSAYAGNGPTIGNGNSITIQTEMVSTAKWGDPQKMKLVLDNFVRLPEGRVRVTFYNEQKIITEKEMKAAVNDLLQVVDEAAELNLAYYKDYVEEAIKARAQAIGISQKEFMSYLDEKVDGTDVTYRELNSLPPPVKKSDFIPAELHLGGLPRYWGVLGATWLNSGIVYYNPQSRIFDYLMDKPLIMMHELIHVNYRLQNYPLANYFDAELMAMIPEGLLKQTQIYIFYHYYLEDLREICHAYFGFDWKEAQKQFIRYDLEGNLYIDEKKFNQVMAMAEKVQDELQIALRKAVAEFYAAPVFWMGFNKKMNDGNAWLWVFFAKHYEPTILGGHKKTRVWLEAHEREIKEMGIAAYKKSGTPRRGDSEEGYAPRGIYPFLVKQYQTLFSAEERKRIEDYFRRHPAELKQLESWYEEGDIRSIIQFMAVLKKGDWR